MLEFNLILGNSRKDVMRWDINKHQIMDADNFGRIPENESINVS